MAEKNKNNNMLYVIVAVVVVVAFVGGAYLVFGSSPVVANGDNVSVYYTGTFTNGTVFGSNVGQTPLVFTVGANELIPGFNDAVIGMKINQTKTVTVPASEGYGQINPELIVSVPVTVFGNQTPEVGMVATRYLNGQPEEGSIIAVNATNATVNFNSPLAGHTLIFKITVVKIQK